jgi:hypothetical protein
MPLQRVTRPTGAATNVFLDAFDLGFSLRGYDWDYSKGLQFPVEYRNTDCKSSFLFSTLVSHIFHLFLFDFSHYSIQVLWPDTVGSPAGGSIIDRTLPPFIRYLRSTYATFALCITVSSAMQATYDLLTIVGITLFNQSPMQWPPYFGPFLTATSLNSFWTRGWHQFFRESFIGIGYKPCYALFGRIGGVFGVFTVSGLMHHYGLLAMGRGGEFWKVFGFFFVMGVGLVVEGLYKKVTGRKVRGFIGFIWTMVWLLGWGHMVVDAWARKGVVGSMFMPDQYRPGKYIITSLFSIYQ